MVSEASVRPIISTLHEEGVGACALRTRDALYLLFPSLLPPCSSYSHSLPLSPRPSPHLPSRPSPAIDPTSRSLSALCLSGFSATSSFSLPSLCPHPGPHLRNPGPRDLLCPFRRVLQSSPPPHLSPPTAKAAALIGRPPRGGR